VKRAPWVVGANGAGLGLLFSFHTKPVHVSLASPAQGRTVSPTSPSTSTSSTSSTTTAGGDGTSVTTTPTTALPTTPPTTAAATRSGTGQDVPYQYGDIQLKVTERGSTITGIEIVADSATDARSAQINSQALPMLQQEAMSAQSANIDGVSGATFTSNAYAQALQSALDRVS
jgi:uncharacterized protein with FMN-binding domain